jgi:hypothetical protein
LWLAMLWDGYEGLMDGWMDDWTGLPLVGSLMGLEYMNLKRKWGMT